MPKYYGCPCEGCGQPLTLRDDIVVCPDCGAPYHRTCYEKLGRCILSPAHAAGYEWKFPYQENALRTCPSCGERTLRSEEHCRCCGAKLPPEGAEQPNDRAEEEQNFDYASFYRQFEEGNVPDPLKEAYQAAFGKEDRMDGRSCTPPLSFTSTFASSSSVIRFKDAFPRDAFSISMETAMIGHTTAEK